MYVSSVMWFGGMSLDFTVNRIFTKLFRTSSIEIVGYCQKQYNGELPSILLTKRFGKFCSS